MIMFKTECLECHRVEYELGRNANPQKLMQMIQRLVADGHHYCYRCKSHKIKFSQIKWKDYQALLVKFPLKKVIRTEKTIEQLLAMEGEWVTNQYPADPDLKED